jgi:hypothetical protein
VETDGWITGLHEGVVAIEGESEGIVGRALLEVDTQLSDADFPNEPAGYSRLTERPFSANNEAGWTDQAVSIVNDAGSLSPPSAGRVAFPAGFTGGSSAGNTWIVTSTEYRRVYVSVAVKVSSNWQGHHSTINKVGNLKDASGAARATLFFTLRGAGSDPLSLMFTATKNGPTNYYQNVNSVEIKRGQWHQIEFVSILNTSPGSDDGELHAWVDGVKTHHHTAISYDDGSGASNYRWEIFEWRPVWGGTGETVEREMYMEMDHLYVSGANRQ